tara:strand:+ start:1070 stop:1801 length:732 start_codon:yes stop_codon:yes gene_type:complete
MKRIIKYLSEKVSRIIYFLIPSEIKNHINNSSNYINKKLNDEKDREVFEIFGTRLKKSLRFSNKKSIRKYAIDLALAESLQKSYKEDLIYLEFGVFKGNSANLFSNYVDKLYVFDSFEGLPHEWEGQKQMGAFNLNKKIPKLNSNIVTNVGLVEETLDDFLKKYEPKIIFIHMDLDSYESTKFTLERIKPYLVKGSIILFDELYNYVNWKEGEYKALKEIFKDYEYVFKAFNINHEQAVIQIT